MISRLSVVLHLDGHCVKTTAHREFLRLVNEFMELLTEPETVVIEAQIQLLRSFLEETDFAALRASDERLTGVVESWVRLSMNGKIMLEILEVPYEQ